MEVIVIGYISTNVITCYLTSLYREVIFRTMVDVHYANPLPFAPLLVRFETQK